MPSLRLSLRAIIPDVFHEHSNLDAIGNQAVLELRRPSVSRWPVRTGRSKRAFTADTRGDDVIIGNAVPYAYEVEHVYPATRGAARRTLERAPARQRIRQAGIKGAAQQDLAEIDRQEQERFRRDERIILEGGPDSTLSREGRLREAGRRLRNRRNRRRQRLARVLNDNQAVRPWERLQGAEINVAARLAASIAGDLGPEYTEDALQERNLSRPASTRILTAALFLARVT